MKKLIPFLLIILTLGCKNKDKFSLDVDPLLVGKWEITAYEMTSGNGMKEWKSVDPLTGIPSFIVRADGAFLERNGKKLCCPPLGEFTMNGKEYLSNPQKAVPYNKDCELTLCTGCRDHQLQINKDEMIWTRCEARLRYRRLP